jgi:hypothetical protein
MRLIGELSAEEASALEEAYRRMSEPSPSAGAASSSHRSPRAER